MSHNPIVYGVVLMVGVMALVGTLDRPRLAPVAVGSVKIREQADPTRNVALIVSAKASIAEAQNIVEVIRGNWWKRDEYRATARSESRRAEVSLRHAERNLDAIDAGASEDIQHEKAAAQEDVRQLMNATRDFR